PHTLFERGGRDRLGKEGAKRGATARPLFLDHAEGAELPREVGQPFGEIAGHADGELPVAWGWHRRHRLAEELLHLLEERRRQRPSLVLRGRLEARERLSLSRVELLGNFEH